ncbi:AAA family ATPase [Demequina sp.]|uniref:McrB family protein n=1 Tax=Demequina sp. TaxID=2050685 RepID=UPI0025BB76D7|nr:AAA family ATPase [Demequina sp.]
MGPDSFYERARSLTADELEIGYTATAGKNPGSSAPDTPALSPESPLVATLLRLLDTYRGIILTGPPGTGKTYYAAQTASMLTGGAESRTKNVQFHASYQFEDFIQGYRPNADGTGFVMRPGVLLATVEAAHSDPGNPYVIIIDELSRADVGRVFGEALTYIERSRRGVKFSLPSGEVTSIPDNLYMIMTMNPQDRGVDEVDAAFERRFAKVAMEPDRNQLQEILAGNGVEDELANRIVGWFDNVNGRAKTYPAAAVGHAYFVSATDRNSLRDIWEFQLRHLVERAFQYVPDDRDQVVRGFERIFAEFDTPPSEATADSLSEG